MLLRSPPHRQAAFTLLELMIVLVIIGIVVGVGLVALGNLGNNQSSKRMQQGMRDTMSFARQQALLQDAPMAVAISEHGFCLQQQDAKLHWQDSHINPLVCMHNSSMQLSLHPLSKDSEHTFISLPQRLLWMPDGSLAHFHEPLLIQLTLSHTRHRIKIDAQGKVLG